MAPPAEGVRDSPLRAFSRLEQSIIASALYPGPEDAASLEEQRRAYALHSPEHSPEGTRPHKARPRPQPEAPSGKLEALRLPRRTAHSSERARTSGSAPSLRGLQARPAREAVRAGGDLSRSCRGRAGAAAVAPVSRAQRTPAHPALRGPHKEAPARSAPHALAEARQAKADTQNVAEDLWEDLCCTLREL